MEFKTFDELQAHNNRYFENSPLGQIQLQSPENIDIDGLTYFERITLNSQPHNVFKLDWSSYGSLDFADTFLPKVGGYKGKAMWIFDGAELFPNLKKSDRKTLSLSNDNKLINLLSYTYPKGVLAGEKKQSVSVGKHEICAFIELKKDNSIEVSFKFGDNFKDFLKNKFVSIPNSQSISTIETTTYKTNKLEFQNYFKNQLVHYDMMCFLIDTIGIKKIEKTLDEIEDDFIPLISVNSEQKELGFKISNNLKETIELSKYIDEDKRTIKLKGIKLETDATIEFNVEQGNEKAKDNEGNITIKAKGVEFISKKKITKLNDGLYNYSIDINDVQYGWKIKLKLTERTLEKDAYLDFYANDDDFLFYSVSNVHCGRVLISSGKKCTCQKSNPAKNFAGLIKLVKQSEDILIENGYDDVNDRISIIRGIYYGTEWSLDYQNEKSKQRNFAFNEYTNSEVVADARKELKCSSTCEADLFESLFNSFEVFDSKYKAVDFGHLIIGLDSRRSWRSINFSIPTQGGTGLELNTWVGDLGAGTGKLALDRVTTPEKRSATLFPVFGSSYGAMVNLEGDIASYVVGMDINNENKIDDATDNFQTIHEALKDYFENKWDKRTYYFLKMIDGEFEGNILINRDELINKCAENFEDFAYWYLGVREGFEALKSAMGYFKPISEEVASIFIDGLIHVIENPQDMITKRTDPDPKPKEVTATDKANDIINNIKDWFD
ncbi:MULTISPECIES: hypothetical protein [Mesonia]|uniref:Uncharacterized protein n=1 Tax=Mesonia oceanica TaxID=2687242 RepID=A0AC61Y4B7_9FLAO|nr:MULTISPECIES: hypothetical protein [Mesonia]MAN28749.1 hypothetical protein [Mesonia sp.]MAQ41920.1 hypothetical protein [Mesonia sp.]VVU99153.1 hypothetical protein FVB9532_00405 [Mesonia oceanica]|tara:strand:+ start:246 stop:2411 length:2166 start_codon:yes stop_codon:yes gene_type:complete